MNTIGGLLRYLAYAAFVAGVAVLVAWTGTRLPGGLGLAEPVAGHPSVTTSEFSLIESMQAAMVIVCALIFSWVALRDRLRRPFALGFVALFGLILLREFGFFFDMYVVEDLWRALSALVLAVACVYLFRHRRRMVSGWVRSWPSAGLGILVSGLFVVILFAQIVSARLLWEALLGPDNAAIAMVAAEELLELCGYLLMTIGSFEFLHGWSLLPETRMMDTPRRGGRRRRRRS